MGARAKDLLRDALELPLNQRAELAADLLASIDGDADADVEAAWGAEIERRARQALADQTQPIPWETVRGQAIEKITRR